MRVLLLVLLALPGVAAAPLLVAVVPDLPGSSAGDEGFALGSGDALDLGGWSVSDGESSWVVPAGTRLEPGVPLWVVGDLAAWAQYDGPPAIEAGSDALRLGNGGD